MLRWSNADICTRAGCNAVFLSEGLFEISKLTQSKEKKNEILCDVTLIKKKCCCSQSMIFFSDDLLFKSFPWCINEKCSREKKKGTLCQKTFPLKNQKGLFWQSKI